ncbi:hypothetical protein BaRGS_00024119 [Batillaria attramentaria]|uniref:SWIM-type domain-containing protein n=1 Tax=Batillaria attramentaria TaxID=370345 RepID=A0ABD0KBV7_9CAEN
MEMDAIRLWRVPVLQNFLRERGLKTTGCKEELVALVWACHVFGKEPVPSASETTKTLAKEYAALLVVNGKRLPDPFTELKEGWQDESAREKWPPTSYADMAEFLLDCRADSKRRRQLLTDYKEGKAYSYFDSKLLHTVFYHEIDSNSEFCFLKAKVTPSQAVNAVPHRAWVAIQKKTGRIVSADCSCMAGLGSSCNHVAAILFKVDWVWGLADKSCTSGACQWNAPSAKKGLEPCRVQDMNFYKPKKHKEAQNINSVAKRLFTTQRSRDDTPLILDELTGQLYGVSISCDLPVCSSTRTAIICS